MSDLFLWNFTNNVFLHGGIVERIKKICNIDNHLYILSSNDSLYHGLSYSVENQEEVYLMQDEELKLKDIDSCNGFLYVVDLSGKVFQYTDSLELVKEIMLIEDSKMCIHGHTGTKFKMKVDKISVGVYGNLFITDSGQLWAMGNMHQIGIDSETPRKVTFFDGRFVYSAIAGNDFAIAIVSKQFSNVETDSDDCEEDVFVSSCPHCISSSHLASPISQNSFSETCPLGIPMPASYDIETTSTSSKNDSFSSNDIKKCLQNDSNISNELIENGDKTEKNIIFRNTEAAKEFLTRQFSWMSSAGEEYLVECTEKPTRIIRENVSNMASLVYEGVKTVGDKVVTLSRHVSGSSENNDTFECIEEMHLPRVTSKDEFMWSMSQCTSEKDISEQGLEDRSNAILKNGSNLINCEVWTWGNIVHGQLGIGDIMKRERPMIITKLSNIGAHKISVQSYHAAALTLDGRAFLWGRNDFHQVTFDSDVDQSSPKLFNTSSKERIKDVACGTYHSSLLSYKSDLYYIGKTGQRSLILHSPNNSDDASEKNETANYRKSDYLFLSSNYTLLNKISSNNHYIVEHLINEQEFLEHMLIVQTNFIKPFQKKVGMCNNSFLYETLCTTYIDLLYFVAANIQSLIDFSNNLISECDIIIYKYVDEHIFVYKNYLEALNCVISLGGCKYISKIIEIPICLYKLVDTNMLKKDKKLDGHIIYSLLIKPFKRLLFYQESVSNIVKHIGKNQRFKEIQNKWNLFLEDQEQKNKEAEMTREFWLTTGKNIEHLQSPERRLIRESHKYPLYLHNAGIFSSHWFILLNDVFIHVSGSTSNIHELQIIWAEPQQDLSNGQYQISLKMPEETTDLYTLQAEEKIQWFHALQNAIKHALGKSNAIQPPSLRTAAYTFTKNGYYKDAKYTGRWQNSKMHGSGKIVWPDGKIYTGQFSHNQIHGFGRMDTPNVGVYEGQWKENQQNGFGILKYENGDVYKGYFKDSVPHGHGSLKQGNFTTSAASIYIGDWIFGAKNGYGVMHDIVSGETYLGTWNENKKHGKGLIVTSDGIYYEGIFNQDTLTGNGLMILEDGTYYEGDFKGTGVLGGKGTLTLKSGHMLEGNLTGSWNEGIKISNGTLSLSKTVHVETDLTPKSFTSFCTPVHQKWKALFRHCYQILGVPENNLKNNIKVPDTQKIWQNVAVVISNSYLGTLKRNKIDRGIENSMKHLDTIPQFGRDSIDGQCFKDIKQYIIKAFECSYHPLGSLLSDLTVAYTTTYGGQWTHPLLLSHAVNELHSITKRLYDIVKLLFPALPAYGQQSPSEEYDESEVISCQSLLYPIILPKVHSPLFILYTSRDKHHDNQYWKRLTEWNKQPDYTLMAFLSVDEKFLEDDSSDQPPSPVSKVKEQHFIEAIETLQLLKTTFSPLEKLFVIRQTFQKMTDNVKEQLGRDYRWNMDDLFPVFLYVVVRARILKLGSELSFIEDFMEPSLENGELGIMFTTLKACYQQILQEKISVT